ncbi:MAG: hypothetical protein KGJ55_09980, partial [Gammaproteobacteria bacterium]|nr:hypothetical protein [Gammaproteobacteria bacterium]
VPSTSSGPAILGRALGAPASAPTTGSRAAIPGETAVPSTSSGPAILGRALGAPASGAREAARLAQRPRS